MSDTLIRIPFFCLVSSQPMVVYPHYPLLIENGICYLHLNVSKGEKTEKMDGENDSRSSYLNLDQSIGINALQNISFQRQLRARGRRLF